MSRGKNMISVVLAFISSPVGRIVTYVTAALFAIGIAFVALKIHESSIRNEALISFNNKQIESTLLSTQQLLKQNEQLVEKQNQILKSIKEKNDMLDASLSKIDQFLNEPDTIANDRPSSDILKRTIKSLKEAP